MGTQGTTLCSSNGHEKKYGKGFMVPVFHTRREAAQACFCGMGEECYVALVVACYFVGIAVKATRKRYVLHDFQSVLGNDGCIGNMIGRWACFMCCLLGM